MKRRRYFFIIFFIFIIYIFSITVNANCMVEYGNIYIYKINNDTDVCLMPIKVIFNEQKNIEGKISKLFALLLSMNYNENQMTLIPKDTKLLGVYYDKGSVQINFSKGILKYGGSSWEQYMIDQVLSTVFSLDEIKDVSLYIEGEKACFVEGTTIMNYPKDKFLERMKEDGAN